MSDSEGEQDFIDESKTTIAIDGKEDHTNESNVRQIVSLKSFVPIAHFS